jgi:8-oxo-dGTP diphosphatase
MNKKIISVVCAVIFDNDKIFCCQRGPYKSLAYKWEFPGGKIEFGETDEYALKREIREELGCNIKVLHFLINSIHEYDGFILNMYAYKCELIDSKPILSEHVDSRWLKLSELTQLDFAEGDIPVVNYIINQ